MGKDTNIAWTLAQAARQAVNAEVRSGVRPHPNAVPCSECAHKWSSGERRHEWHHHRGYERAHWFDVISLCTKCHAGRGPKASKTHCVRGHEFTSQNTHRRKNGTRECRACRRIQKRRQRTAAWWRERRSRKAVDHG